MSKRAFLIHGWEGSPDEGWRPWLKKKLVEKNFKVIVPAMPDSASPTLDKWLSHLTNIVKAADEETYFVGHSLGCITILRYLETLKENHKVGGAVLVAGFADDLEYEGYNGELSNFFQKPLGFDKVKDSCKNFVVVHSGDDPWVPLKYGKSLAKNLNCKLIKETGMKHYSGDDGITKVPSILTSLLEISS